MSDYPAIDRVLGVLKSRLGVDSERHVRSKRTTDTTAAVVSQPPPLWKRALMLADRLERQRQQLHRLQLLSSPQCSVDDMSKQDEAKRTMKRVFLSWQQAVLERKLRKQENCAPTASQVFSRAMKEQCVRRRGKHTLAVLYSRWALKRRALSQWMQLFVTG